MIAFVARLSENRSMAMSNGFTRIARIALIAVASAIVAGCTTWDLPQSVKAEMGIVGIDNSVSLRVTYHNTKGEYVYCKAGNQESFWGDKSWCGAGESKLTPAQVAIFLKYLNPSEEDDEAAESTPGPGQIDTAVPGATTAPACVPGPGTSC